VHAVLPGWGEASAGQAPTAAGWAASTIALHALQSHSSAQPRRPTTILCRRSAIRSSRLQPLPDVSRFAEAAASLVVADDSHSSGGVLPSHRPPGQVPAAAFSLISSSKTREAFDLSREPERVRDHYGGPHRSSLLTAAGWSRRECPSSAPRRDFRQHRTPYDMHEEPNSHAQGPQSAILDRAYQPWCRI